MELEKKKQILGLLLEKNILIDKATFENSSIEDLQRLLVTEKKPVQKKENKEEPKKEEKKDKFNVEVIYNYTELNKKRDIKDFVAFYNKRFEALRGMLRQRFEMKNIISVNKVLNKRDRGEVSIIGLISEMRKTKNGHTMLTIEDNTGTINALINVNRKDLEDISKELVLDEVIGIVGSASDKIIFVNKVVIPDIPIANEFKKAKDEVYAIFLSDLHIGSDKFLPDKFEHFLKWLAGEVGNESQKKISSKIKYVFIIGDVVEGVGIYPAQEKELKIKDIYKQYETCAEYLKKIPEHINIIICPGNHDAVRIAEPQPIIPKEFAKGLSELPNVTLVTSPSYINIHSSETFPGFNVLMYHGFSFVYYADKIDTLREKGGVDRIDLVMKFLLQKRHLAPTHTSNLYIPDDRDDPFVIHKVPDFFITGHVHKAAASNFRGTTLISGSCWQDKTSFQEKVGLHPEPARVPVVNLQTREVRILKF